MKLITIDKAENYSRIITSLVEQFKYRFPPYIGTDDLKQEAVHAMMNAIIDYNPDKGANDTTFVYKYVKTSLLNYSRKFEKVSEQQGVVNISIPDNTDAINAILDISDACTRLEWSILECWSMGMTKKDISEKFSIHRAALDKMLVRIQRILDSMSK